MCLSVVVLSGCRKDKEEEVAVVQPTIEAPVVEENTAVADIPTGEFSEYQLNVDIVSTDVD